MSFGGWRQKVYLRVQYQLREVRWVATPLLTALVIRGKLKTAADEVISEAQQSKRLRVRWRKQPSFICARVVRHLPLNSGQAWGSRVVFLRKLRVGVAAGFMLCSRARPFAESGELISVHACQKGAGQPSAVGRQGVKAPNGIAHGLGFCSLHRWWARFPWRR
jgi:hypothetical protein